MLLTRTGFSVKKIGLSCLTIAILAGLAPAVTPALWRFGSEADFAKSERKSTVVNSHGDVTLGRKIEIILASGGAPAVVSGIAVSGKTVYVASGTDGWIYKITPKKATKKNKAGFEHKKFAKIPSTMVTCLIRKGKTLLAGGGGTKAGIYAVSPDGKVKKVFADPDIKYFWAIVPYAKGQLYAATGPKGSVYAIDSKGKGKKIYSLKKEFAKNILCLALRDDGKLLAGTDQSGLVLEIDPAAKTGRVILDASEKEISAIVPAIDGGLFVATSDASKAGASPKSTSSKNGKPESRPTTKPTIPTKPTTTKAFGKTKSPATQPAKAANKTVKKPTKPAPAKKPQLKVDSPTKKAPTKSAKTPSVKKLPAKKIAKNTAKGKTRIVNTAKKSSSIKAAMLAAINRRKSGKTSKPSGKGNAVYHIDSRGMVRTIFRKPVTIHAMIAQGGRLVLATGNEGKLWYVTKDGMLSGELVDTDANQVTALVETPSGDLLFATSNKGSVGQIGNTFSSSGSLTSKASDAKQIAQWGTLKLTGAVPDETTITIATRSGNLAKPDDSTWSSWSKEQPLDSGYLPIGSPAARFLQYRATFTSSGKVTPSLGSVRIVYQVGNLAPAVLSVMIKAGNKGIKPTQRAMNKAFRLVAIKAIDPNGDKLKYTVDYRPIRTARWVEITDTLKSPKYVWDTRTVADGLYELRITASDSPSNIQSAARNASRVSEPITVDNTPPALEKIAAEVKGDKALVRGQANDGISRIVSMQYSVDSVEKWKTVLPTDGICDSTNEVFRFETDELKPGSHRISIRATDEFGNVGYAGVNVIVKK